MSRDFKTLPEDYEKAIELVFNLKLCNTLLLIVVKEYYFIFLLKEFC